MRGESFTFCCGAVSQDRVGRGQSARVCGCGIEDTFSSFEEQVGMVRANVEFMSKDERFRDWHWSHDREGVLK